MIFDINEKSNTTALIEGERRCTYEELSEMVGRIASGLSKRSLVFTIVSNTVASIAGYLSFLENDIVPLLLEAHIHKDMFDNLIEIYDPKYLYLPEERKQDLGVEGREIKSVENYVMIERQEKAPTELHPDLALLISTSGSTGSPKLVRLTRENIESNTASIIEYLKITEEEKAITSLPMNYVYGLSIINTHLAAGASIVLTNQSPYGKGFWKLFDEEEVTSFSGVPFMYEMLYKLDFTSKQHPTLKTLTQAGGKIPEELHKVFADYAKENGKDFIVMYGASEATARMGYLPAKDAVERCGSMGIPIPGGRFEIWDAEEKPVEKAGETGELVYYGKNVSLGYAETKADLKKEDENKGRLLTGDMAYRDEDGYYYISGRKKRFIKVLGRRTNLDEVERLLKTEYNEVNLACTGEDNHLIICNAAGIDEKELRNKVSEMLDINKKMISVISLEDIPKNESGKVQYSLLKELAGKEKKNG